MSERKYTVTRSVRLPGFVYVVVREWFLRPAEARQLASELLEAADEIDPPTPPSVPVDTSEDAAKAIRAETARFDRVEILRHLSYGNGRTDEEIAYNLMMNPSTVRPRRGELVKSGLVVDSGARRKTKSGRRAIVWVAR